MQHLVASETTVTRSDEIFVPRCRDPKPRTPFFGVGTLTPELAKLWREFYVDVAVLAFPTPKRQGPRGRYDEKAMYFRAPYSSQPGVKPFLPEPDAATKVPRRGSASPDKASSICLRRLTADGRLEWDVPAGDWTILRFGRTMHRTNDASGPRAGPGVRERTSSTRRPSTPISRRIIGKLLEDRRRPRRHSDRGLTMVHFDSWEMSSQNWSRELS